MLHWTTVEWDFEADAPAIPFGELAAKLQKHNVEYNAVGWVDGVHQLVPYDHVAWHAGKAQGVRDPNTTMVGYAIPYASPSFSPRGLEREREYRFWDRANDRFRTAWYPPISAKWLDQAVEYFRHVQEQMESSLAAIYMHHQLDGVKNDLRNLDAQEGTPNCAYSYSEVLGRVAKR